MKTSITQKRRPDGLISVGVVLAAIVISLMMQGSTQAWWAGTFAINYEASDGKIWTCIPYTQYGYYVPGGAVWYCSCFYIWGSGYREYTILGDYWFFYDYQSGKATLLWRGGW